MFTATKIQMIRRSIMSSDINACLNELNISWCAIILDGDLDELKAADRIFFEKLSNLLSSLSLNNEELRKLNVIIHEYLSEHLVRKKLIENVYRQESMRLIKIEVSQTLSTSYLPVDDLVVRKIDLL